VSVDKLVGQARLANSCGATRSAQARFAPGLRWFASLVLLVPALFPAGCGGYPDLRDVPPRPTDMAPLETRAEIGNELLADLDRQRYERELLRYRVGLVDRPPDPPLPRAPLGPPQERERVVVLAPGENLPARFLRQQIRAEIDSDTLNGFMNRIAADPLAIDPLAYGLEDQESPAEPSVFGFEAEVDELNAALYRPTSSAAPLLDRFLVAVGAWPQGR
jgi:hypothetical protein